MHSKQHIFAIGDVHGRADLLKALLSEIAEAASRDKYAYRIIFLGDIIDKGPASRQAMDTVIETIRTINGSQLILGNHDAIILSILDETDPEKAKTRMRFWIERQHGLSTLTSYGFDLNTLSVDGFRERFDDHHVNLLRNAALFVELPNHLLVHAGLRPGIPLDSQDPKDLMWIKEPFLSDRSSHGKTVVHGHTPTASEMPEVYSNRIAIDTGACKTGILTAAHIVGSEVVGFLATREQSGIKVGESQPILVTDE